MKFWENHAVEMRRARLLAASAIIFTKGTYPGVSDAVDAAFDLESRIDFKLQQAKKAEEKE